MKNLDEEAEKLDDVLKQALELLTTVGEERWSQRLQRALTGGVHADQVITWFGGTGSFGDLLIMVANGHRIAERDEFSINRRLLALQREIYDLAEVLARASK
jgi:hypothetical protein